MRWLISFWRRRLPAEGSHLPRFRHGKQPSTTVVAAWTTAEHFLGRANKLLLSGQASVDVAAILAPIFPIERRARNVVSAPPPCFAGNRRSGRKHSPERDSSPASYWWGSRTSGAQVDVVDAYSDWSLIGVWSQVHLFSWEKSTNECTFDSHLFTRRTINRRPEDSPRRMYYSLPKASRAGFLIGARARLTSS